MQIADQGDKGMKKTILITGSTDGIGLVTAHALVKLGHTVLLHGRNESKLQAAQTAILQETPTAKLAAFVADLSSLQQVTSLAKTVSEHYPTLDVLINNAGVHTIADTTTQEGLDTRFTVNTIAPYLLTRRLLAQLKPDARVVNLSSAAQADLNPTELRQPSSLPSGQVYAKSKLALTMWSRGLAEQIGKQGPVVVAVNPASLLGSKMVKEAYGIAGGDLTRGADILVKAALSDEFAEASGLYFDNDIPDFSDPHPDALNSQKVAQLMQQLDTIVTSYI
ncbi:SDR family NAD(P)-dependent oxidoreductase [Neptunomonas phycophila]|uniref:SDR family NAD(P)-dependent oxidoreductase n=1 Tax=Neptunomonas phycophila TaxID=1572645 RepID=UPI0026E1A779|nr:SDR family NAD(P)-dependent oxidoreductase [Neptunomonas phycophila]MDO6783878.1 SDR family NAD(P)-dependent oxidoreductase [Neptunomonas phycophila]